MIELHLDLKFKMKPWKKALALSFLFYLIILFVLIVIITFMEKGFKFSHVAIISGVYLTGLVLSFRYMYRKFRARFTI